MMSRGGIIGLAFFLGTVLLVSVFSTACAYIDCSNSVADNCLVVCPEGDKHFTVIVKDQKGLPMEGAYGYIQFWAPCTSQMYIYCSSYGDWPRIWADSPADANGRLIFTPYLGGSCTTPADIVLGWGTKNNFEIACTMGSLWAPRSPDINADGYVNTTDYSLFGSLWGSSDFRADYNCDGTVGPADYAIFASHYNDVCQ